MNTLSQLGDLSGDGLSSLASIGPRSVRIYANRREEGFARGEEVEHKPVDDRLPLFSNSPQRTGVAEQFVGQRHERAVPHPA
ncbi:hypothetical protein ACFS4T_27500 [Pseudomonas lini]